MNGHVSSTGVQVADGVTRKHLSARQVQTVDGLIEAAVAELRNGSYGDFSVRAVARRAGVAPATAYTYFASKEHLVAEMFWRRFRSQPHALSSPHRVDRVIEALGAFGLVVADETELAAACTVAVLAEDPDVADLREQIGAELHRRLADALRPDADPAVIRTLRFAVSGALVQIGTGHLAYDDLPQLLDEMARTVLGETAR